MCVYLCRLQPWLVGAQYASPSCCSMASWLKRRCRPTNAMAGGNFPPRSRLNGGRFGPLLIEGPSCCVWTHQVCTSHLSSVYIQRFQSVALCWRCCGLWVFSNSDFGHCISCIDYMPSPVRFVPPLSLPPCPCYHPRPLPHPLLTL